MKDLSIIIVSYNTKNLLKNCLDSIVNYTHKINYEIVVVDNGSTDGSVEMLRKFTLPNSKFQKVLNRTNFGFSKANNQGIKIAKGKYILLLNSDTLIKENVLRKIVDWMEKNSQAGVVSCALRNKDGSLQATGGYFPTLARVFSWMTIQDLPFVDRLIKPFHPLKAKSFLKDDQFYQKKRQLDWVTGAFFLVRRKVIDEVGYFDEDYFMYTEDTDYCFRAKKHGWQIWYLPKWSTLHLGGASGTSWSYVVPEYRGLKLFYKKHYPSWQYPLLRFFLKIGAFMRMFLFGFLEGGEATKAYAKAFKEA